MSDIYVHLSNIREYNQLNVNSLDSLPPALLRASADQHRSHAKDAEDLCAMIEALERSVSTSLTFLQAAQTSSTTAAAAATATATTVAATAAAAAAAASDEQTTQEIIETITHVSISSVGDIQTRLQTTVHAARALATAAALAAGLSPERRALLREPMEILAHEIDSSVVSLQPELQAALGAPVAHEAGKLTPALAGAALSLLPESNRLNCIRTWRNGQRGLIPTMVTNSTHTPPATFTVHNTTITISNDGAVAAGTLRGIYSALTHQMTVLATLCSGGEGADAHTVEAGGLLFAESVGGLVGDFCLPERPLLRLTGRETASDLIVLDAMVSEMTTEPDYLEALRGALSQALSNATVAGQSCLPLLHVIADKSSVLLPLFTSAALATVREEVTRCLRRGRGRQGMEVAVNALRQLGDGRSAHALQPFVRTVEGIAAAAARAAAFDVLLGRCGQEGGALVLALRRARLDRGRRTEGWRAALSNVSLLSSVETATKLLKAAKNGEIRSNTDEDLVKEAFGTTLCDVWDDLHAAADESGKEWPFQVTEDDIFSLGTGMTEDTEEVN